MWKTHYDKIKKDNHPPSATLITTLNLLKTNSSLRKIKAIDLGCGNGVDTIAMLENGYDVLAIDTNFNSLKDILNAENKGSQPRLIFKNTSFENLTHLPEVDLVNASFSLPFCNPTHFNQLWSLIHECIIPEGYFSGHFFGMKDSWSSNKNMSFHSLQEVKGLFKDFDIINLEETSKFGKTLSGKEKYWHVFHVVAQKNHLGK